MCTYLVVYAVSNNPQDIVIGFHVTEHLDCP